MAVRKTYPRQSLIVQEGDPGERFYLLRKGRAKVYLGNEAGREVILSILGPGAVGGFLAAISYPAIFWVDGRDVGRAGRVLRAKVK